MKERPILMSAPMVRALLAGTKTQTRRIVKPQPAPGDWLPTHTPAGWRAWRRGDTSGGDYWTIGGKSGACPHGSAGDRLWVRETHALRQDCEPGSDKAKHYVMYAADGGSPRDPLNWHDYGDKWRPSIHMPRWASRITLEITDVRVERLQEISNADAIAEGAPPSHHSIDVISRQYGYEDFSRSWYAQLWDSINGPGSWDANPWVWVVCFKRVTS